MTPEVIIQACFEDGVILSINDDGRAAYRGDKAMIEAWLPILKEHKAGILTELHRQRRHAVVLSMLGDRKYAVLVENEHTDPVICTVAIRGLATFDMAIPKHSYNGMVLLELIERHSKAQQQPGNAIPSPDSSGQAHPNKRAA